MTAVPYNDSPDSPKSKFDGGSGQDEHDGIDSSSQLEDVVELSDSKSLDPAREKALLRKIDWHVVPWLSLLYLLSFLDRANIGNARVCSLLHYSGSLY